MALYLTNNKLRYLPNSSKPFVHPVLQIGEVNASQPQLMGGGFWILFPLSITFSTNIDQQIFAPAIPGPALFEVLPPLTANGLRQLLICSVRTLAGIIVDRSLKPSRSLFLGNGRINSHSERTPVPYCCNC